MKVSNIKQYRHWSAQLWNFIRLLVLQIYNSENWGIKHFYERNDPVGSCTLVLVILHGARVLRIRPSTAAKQGRFSMSVSSLQVRTQLFFPSFMYNNIHIPLNADLQKKGPISELSVQSLYLLSPNGEVGQDLTLGRQFSQRPNVINGCHLRGAARGWNRKEKVV